MKLLLIDGNSIMNRAYYGIRPLTNSKGFNTNALYGFLTTLHRHIAEEGDCRIAVAFDLKAPTYRHLMYKDYKAGRHAMPDELREQFPAIKEILDSMGITRIEKEGLEADDIIGILSRSCSEKNEPCIIITGDRDSFQLVDGNVTVKLATTKQGGTQDEIYTPKAIEDRYGITTAQLIDLKALMGDSSDNIPGVPGVGEKTALGLLKDYGSLEGIYENLDNIRGALHTKLENGKDSAYLSRSLGTIIRKSELLPINESDIPKYKYNESEFLRLLSQYELSRIIKLYGLDTSALPKATEREPSTDIKDLNIAESNDYSAVKGEPVYIMFDGESAEIKADDKIYRYKMCKDFATAVHGKKIVTHDAKPLLKALLDYGCKAEPVFDTMLAAYILNPSLSSYPLSAIINESSSVPAQTTAEQCYYLPEARGWLERKMEENGQTKLYYEIELPLCAVLADMEHYGVQADGNFLRDFGKKLDEDIDNCRQAIYLYAGHEFNINSTKQLGEVLFTELELPVIKKTKTGFSTDNDVLEKLNEKCDDPIIGNIIEYRKLTKLKSTYIDGLLRNIGADGRIHTVFTQTVTQTGRISSVEPNLQNIPVRTELGRQLRKAFTAKEGCVLLDADYSQIELRVLSHIADDKAMKSAFTENRDIHTSTAAQVFGLPEQLITPELRRRAKAVNFGIVYGIGEYSLAQDIGVSYKEAKRYIENYFTTYSGIKAYMDNIIAEAENNGYVCTMWGRRRYVPDINAKNKQLRAFASRVCRNTPIQGTAADLIKAAMVKVHKRLAEDEPSAKLILQIHDELIVEVPEENAERAAEILRHEMEHAAELSVPLIAEVGIGKSWYESK